MSDEIGTLLGQVKAKDIRALAKLLSQLDRMGGEALKYAELSNPPQLALRIGITGPPGAGKSTLVNQIIGYFRKQKLTVGVLAVDPSSPFTQGAILGDRIRYSEHFQDDGVFIRSVGTRGSLGGLSASAYLFLRAFDLFGFDVVLIETVGVGQTELEVMYVSDVVTLVLVPESGDSIQAMKAGVIEIADQFVVNKSDRPGADALVRELEASIMMNSKDQKAANVYKTNALSGEGLQTLCAEYQMTLDSKSFASKRNNPERLRQEAKSLMRKKWESEIDSQLAAIKTPNDLTKFF